MKTKIKPLGDRVLLKRKLVSEDTQEGIYIPDSARKKNLEAEVIAIGTGRKNEKGKLVPLVVKIGDTVLLPEYGGTEIIYEAETYLIVSEDAILGIFQ
jgi:chaperonin GroES